MTTSGQGSSGSRGDDIRVARPWGIMTLSGGPDDGYVESMEGDFVDDRLTGEGIITSSGGQKRIGTFSNGSLVNGSWLRRDGSVVATYQNGRPSYSPDDDRGTSESGVVGPLLGVLQAAASARGRNAVVAQSPASTAGSAAQSGSGVCDPTPRGPDFAGNQRCCEKEGGVFDNQKTGWVCRKRGGKYGCAGPAWQCWAQ